MRHSEELFNVALNLMAIGVLGFLIGCCIGIALAYLLN